MQLFNFRIQETEHLPPTERTEILNRCLISNEMRRYKRIAPKVCGVLTLAFAGSFILAAPNLWNWSFIPSMIIGIVVTLSVVFFLLIAKVALEIWILRKLIRKEVQK